LGQICGGCCSKQANQGFKNQEILGPILAAAAAAACSMKVTGKMEKKAWQGHSLHAVLLLFKMAHLCFEWVGPIS